MISVICLIDQLFLLFFFTSASIGVQDLLSSSPALFVTVWFNPVPNMNDHFGPWIISHDILSCPIICHYCPITLACLRTFWMFHWLIHIYCGEFTGNVFHFLYDLLNKSKTIFRCIPLPSIWTSYIYPIVFSQHCPIFGSESAIESYILLMDILSHDCSD